MISYLISRVYRGLYLIRVVYMISYTITLQGGQYVITLLDTHAAPVALIFICFVEAVAVSWFYGKCILS